MKSILTILFICLACVAMWQTKPKKRIHRDTIKTVQERIEYLPDTIPVYFKEVVISRPDSIPSNMGKAEITSAYSYTVYESWRKGFVVWQTYKTAYTFSISGTGSTGGFTLVSPTASDFYKDEYEPTRSMPGIFLYGDKTRCKNLVIYSIKR